MIWVRAANDHKCLSIVYANGVSNWVVPHLRAIVQNLADTVGVHLTQLRRYEAGTNQPTLDVLRALAVSADELVFTPDDRGPKDESLRLHLEALDQLDPDERAGIRALIEGALLRHQARRFAQTS